MTSLTVPLDPENSSKPSDRPSTSISFLDIAQRERANKKQSQPAMSLAPPRKTGASQKEFSFTALAMRDQSESMRPLSEKKMDDPFLMEPRTRERRGTEPSDSQTESEDSSDSDDARKELSDSDIEGPPPIVVVDKVPTGHPNTKQTAGEGQIIKINEVVDEKKREKKIDPKDSPNVTPSSKFLLPDKITDKDFDYMHVFTITQNGKVVRVRYKKDQKMQLAMKIIKKRKSRKGKSDAVNQGRNEITMLKHLIGVPYVVQIKQTVEHSKYLCILLDLLSGGNLKSLVEHRREDPTRKKKANFKKYEDMCRVLVAELVLGIGAVHRKNVIHCHLAPQNIVMDNAGHIRLVDFGVSTKVDKDTPSCTMYQANLGSITEGYVAPEMLKGEEFSYSADWWNLGLVLYYLLSCGHHPFETRAESKPFSDKKKTKMYKIKNLKRPSKEANNFVSQLLQIDPSKRLGGTEDDWEEVCGHPWFTHTNWLHVRKAYQRGDWVLTGVSGYQMPVFPTNEKPFFEDIKKLMSWEREKMQSQLKSVGIL